MGKNNLNLNAMNSFITGGELKLMELNQNMISTMNEPLTKWQGKSKKKQVKKHKPHGQSEVSQEATMPQVESGKPLNRRAEAIRQMHEHDKPEPVEAAPTYWQEAIILSEIIGQPVCKRRNRRRSRNI